MPFARRHALFAGAAVVTTAGAYAAAWWLLPAPQPVFGLARAEAPRLNSLAGAKPHATPVAPAEASFRDAEGGEHRLAEFAGQGLVVNLWATWCVPCVAEMPALQAMAKALEKDGIRVLALSSDRGGAAVVRKFYAENRIDGLDLWLDPKGEAARAWGARGLPTTLLIDRQGRETARLEGAWDWASDEGLGIVRKLTA